MSDPEAASPPPPPPSPAERDAAIEAVLAAVPLAAMPAAPQWVDTRNRAVDPESLY